MGEQLLKGIQVGSETQVHSRHRELRKLRNACEDFESIFITQMLKSMSSAMVQENLLGNTHESRIFKSMFHENLAIGISKSGGIGIGRVLYEKLKDQRYPEMQEQVGDEDNGKNFHGDGRVRVSRGNTLERYQTFNKHGRTSDI